MNKKFDLRVANGLLALLLFLPGCSSGNLKPEIARKVIATELSVPEKQITINSTSGMSNTVVADASVKLSFMLQMGNDGKWHVLKISRTPGQWENLKDFRLQSALSRSLQTALLSELEK